MIIIPSDKNKISAINSKSGTIIGMGRNKAFSESGNSVLPAYSGFKVTNNPQFLFKLI